MSERSKGDVSSRVNNNANRIVKNPLLSASVTGLSFDDYPNKPLLLPAAPPVVHAPPPQPTNALIAGILNREPKTLVTVGQSSSIDDNETLDEINLNASGSDDSATANASINPYQRAADANANPLLEPQPTTDSLLSQAASSFGALPSVASNVFSTFSKRIYAGTREADESTPSQPQLDIQPTYIQQAGQVAPPPPAPFYAAPPSVLGEAAPEPPKLYAPTELPSVGASSLPPTASTGQNTYRISAKKKLYAPIPGFSEQQQHQQPIAAVATPFNTPPYPAPQAAPQPASLFEPSAPPVQEERKSAGGLFSLTSLVPTGVLQNISGLVQSATGRTNEPTPAPINYNAPNPAANPASYFDITTGPTNYYTPAAGVPPVAPNNYFVPTEAPPPIGGFFNPSVATSAPEPVAPPAIGGYFTPATVQQPATIGYPPAINQPQTVAKPPTAAYPSAVAKPQTAYQPPATAQPPAVAYPPATAQPPASVYPPAAVQPPTLAAAVVGSTPVVGPPPVAAAAPPPASGQASYRLQKGTRLYKSPLTAQETTATAAPFGQPALFAPPTAATAAIFNPFGGTQATEVALFAAPSQEVPLFPPGPSGPTTSLFSQQTTAGSEISQTAPPLSASLFTPVAQPTSSESSQGLALFPPPTINPHIASKPQTPVPSVSPAVIQEVPLFAAPSTTAATSSASTQEVPLFGFSQPLNTPGPATSLYTPQLVGGAETKPETHQEVPLFAAPPTIAAATTSTLGTTQGLSFYPTGHTSAFFSEVSEPQHSDFISKPTQEDSSQEIPLFPSSTTDAPQGISLFTPGPTTSLFAPEVPQEATNEDAVLTSSVAEGLSLYPPAQTASSTENTQLDQETPIFVPVPTALKAPDGEDYQGVDLYPPVPTAATNVDPVVIPTTTSHSQAILSTTSLFAPLATTEERKEASVAAENPTPASQSTPGFSTSDLFAQPSQLPSVALTTQTTTTFFNPFEQTITTPLPQDLLPPPIGFVAPSNQTDANALFEAQTIEPVLPETEKASETVKTLPPPPSGKPTDNSTNANPFRRNSEVAATSSVPTPLQSFFTPAASGSDFNFFGAPQPAQTQQVASGQFPDLPQQADIAPPALTHEPAVSDISSTVHSTNSLGFEQLISDSQQTTQQTQNSTGNIYQNSSVNSFSGYFGGSVEAAVSDAQPQQEQEQPQLTGCNSANFFDHFAAGGQGQEDQRIQNFFNNPPLQDQPAAPGELKYDLVHSGLQSKRFEERSQTSVSNQVEPPSSACSEFSTAAPANVSPLATQQPARQAEYLLQLHQGELPEEILQQLRMATEKGQAIAPPSEAIIYTPVLQHWFYKRNMDGKFVWTPFSHYDSALLETSLNSDDTDSSCIVAVEGGRYDVNIKERTKVPVFWEGKAIEVRRCSWFYKAVDGKYVPYAEDTAAALEIEYKHATETNEWHKKIPLANGEQVTMHGPSVIVHFMPPANADTWGGSVQSSTRPLVVKRDLNDFKIQQGESQRVDHLLFMVHGVGSACDLRMRNVEEVVNDFRNIAQQLVQSHYKNSTDMGLVGRVEVLPIEWHGQLHSEELGIDEKLKSITLESIPRLRNFTNDTLLDVLFYTSPKYCQKIMNTVADALNETYLKYRMRHPEFNGGVSLAGHSLGSLILFDLLCHQESLKESEEENKENPDQLPQKQGPESSQVQLPHNDRMLHKQVSYAMGMGSSGTGQPVINYTQLIFHPKKFFALGSPIGMFVTIRGIDKLGLDFRLPTCPGFYNIFHPFDPVAYRIEALVNPDMKGIRPVLIPHHKGRKRMHLELKETMTRVGADIKQRFMDTFKTTLDSVNFLATVTKVKKEAEESLEKEVHSSSSQLFQKDDQDQASVATTSTLARNRTDSESTTASDPEFIELDFPLGKLNDSKRLDYVLQEAPLEFINEYIFAIGSHVCYWGSEDTILFVMKEIYAGLGISTDSQVPQQSLIIERPSSRNNSVSQSLLPM